MGEVRLVDLDQQIFVPIVDESEGTSYEMQMTIGEMFDRFMDGFKPNVVDAIPIEWLRMKQVDLKHYYDHRSDATVDYLIWLWDKEAK